MDDKICKGIVSHCDVLVIAMLLCMLSLHQLLIANLLFGNGIAITRTRFIHGVSNADLDKKCYVMMEAMIKT